MRIHGIIYLVIGALVSFVSWRLSINIFFYIGLVFIAVGVFKLLVGFILKEKEGFPKQMQQPLQPRAVPQSRFSYCPRCNLHIGTSNFCPNCGLRLG